MNESLRERSSRGIGTLLVRLFQARFLVRNFSLRLARPERRSLGPVEVVLEVEGNPSESEKHRDLYQRSDGSGEGLIRIDSVDGAGKERKEEKETRQ